MDQCYKQIYNVYTEQVVTLWIKHLGTLVVSSYSKCFWFNLPGF